MRPAHLALLAVPGLVLCALIVAAGKPAVDPATGVAAIAAAPLDAAAPATDSRPPRPHGYRRRWARQNALQTRRIANALDELFYRDGRLTVGVEEGIDPRAVAHDYGLVLIGADPVLRLGVVRGPKAALKRLNRAVLRDPRLRYVSPPEIADFALGASVVRPQAANTPVEPTEGVLVGVVDTGLGDGLAGKVSHAWHFPSESPNATDPEGHGTWVSTIAASECGCPLDVAKIRFRSPSTHVHEAVAIRRLVDDGAWIVNLSFGGSVPTDEGGPKELVDAMSYAIAHGVLLVAAMGNDHDSRLEFPASALQPAGGAEGWGLAVGAVGGDGRRASFSSWGPHLSLLAPGTFHPAGSDLLLFGTSFAAPRVAAAAARVWAARPGLTNREVARIVARSASRPAGAGWNQGRGWGVLDVGRALATDR